MKLPKMHPPDGGKNDLAYPVIPACPVKSFVIYLTGV
jgi:hypothetical protein